MGQEVQNLCVGSRPTDKGSQSRASGLALHIAHGGQLLWLDLQDSRAGIPVTGTVSNCGMMLLWKTEAAAACVPVCAYSKTAEISLPRLACDFCSSRNAGKLKEKFWSLSQIKDPCSDILHSLELYTWWKEWKGRTEKGVSETETELGKSLGQKFGHKTVKENILYRCARIGTFTNDNNPSSSYCLLACFMKVTTSKASKAIPGPFAHTSSCAKVDR
ncbi:hypothetical protein Anapl_12017 [Anas platyrhynchos]|uniref:Uncharacterized protein n=1 Tax=Anas platyrhynchos TaxID=8839 RepID=R0KDY3_ANAPL|nr:hypothetical protein Anapl_12017 [Anas platyrhynchos]